MDDTDALYANYAVQHIRSVINHFTRPRSVEPPTNPCDYVSWMHETYYDLLSDVLTMRRHFSNKSAIDECVRLVRAATRVATTDCDKVVAVEDLSKLEEAAFHLSESQR